MNIGMLLFLFLIACASIMGMFFVANQNQAPVLDTYGNGLSDQSNNTSVVVQSVVDTGMDVGSGIVIFVALIIAVVILVLMVSAATKRGGRL